MKLNLTIAVGFLLSIAAMGWSQARQRVAEPEPSSASYPERQAVGTGEVANQAGQSAHQFDFWNPSDLIERALEYVDRGKTKFKRKELRIERISYPADPGPANLHFIALGTTVTNQASQPSCEDLMVEMDHDGKVLMAWCGTFSWLRKTEPPGKKDRSK